MTSRSPSTAPTPTGLAAFWAEALGYRLQDPPKGFESWEQAGEPAGAYALGYAAIGLPQLEGELPDWYHKLELSRWPLAMSWAGQLHHRAAHLDIASAGCPANFLADDPLSAVRRAAGRQSPIASS